MKKIIFILVLPLILAGCVTTKDFKRAQIQAEICENSGYDYELSDEDVGYLSDIVCIPN